MNKIFLALSQLSIKEPVKTTSPEIELLLCCAKTQIEPSTEKYMKLLLQKDIDWAFLFQESVNHGVMPLLYQTLKSTCPEAVPEKILTKLRFHYQANEIRNHYLSQELIYILNKFQTEGIIAVSFKGPSLSIMAYSNLSLRQFSDLDILVDKNNFLEAKSLLEQSEFKAINNLKWLNSLEKKLYFQEIAEFAFIKQKQSIDVICDLHQAITVSHFRKSKIELSELHDKLTNITLDRTEILTIQTEYLLILLCIHGSRHFWHQLNWICDINELISSHKEIDWLEVLNEATIIGCKYHLLLGLDLSSYYLGTTIPEYIQVAIAKTFRIKFLSKYIRGRIFISSDNQTDQGFNIGNFVYQMLLINSWQGYREILDYFIIPTSKDKLIFKLPSFLSFIYYFLRPVRLFYQFIEKKKS